VGRASPKEAATLGEHLAWLAVWGRISPDTADGILATFVAHAPTEARCKALESIARGLHRTTEAVADAVVERLKRLFDWWKTQVIARRDAGDLAAFGWWFTSAIFDPDWALSSLADVLNATGGAIEWDYDVAERLAQLALTHPESVVTCLDKLLDRDTESRARRCEESIRSILTMLGGTRAASAAKQIANRLVARRLPQFADLA
jgi:hypothetical protein